MSFHSRPSVLLLLLLCSALTQAFDWNLLNPFNRVRTKRQVYPVHVGGVKGIMFSREPKEESGPWGPFEDYSQCSRTCGLGTKIEVRKCNGNGCKGPDRRYVTCNTEPCPEGSLDFRSTQCVQQNDQPLEGNYYKWKPHYNERNKCILQCSPDGETWFYKFADKVQDGTPCDNSLTNDVCVDGHCVQVGCDKSLLSTQKEDNCLVCDGDGSTCKTSEGLFEPDDQGVEPGYHDILTIPAGSTSIKVSERSATDNYIAVKNSSGEYVLNGNWKFTTANAHNLHVAGVAFSYDTRNAEYSEVLQARGPTTEDITIALVYQGTSGAIQWQYSTPINEADYIYTAGEWSQCTVTCGAGVNTRQLNCVETATNAIVDESICEENNASKPETEMNCTTINCESTWFLGSWEDCSHTCGENGQQYRVVYCQRVFADGRKITVDDAQCKGQRPEYKQVCNRFSCPEWNQGPWSACSKPCGEALQFRSVTCRSEKEGDQMKLMPAAACTPDEKADMQRSCNLGPCQGLTFVTTEWQLCAKCNDTSESREVSCSDESGRKYPDDKCSDERPLDMRSCATPVPCVYKWQASQWSECSTNCGNGHQDRGVVCAIDQEGSLEIMDDSHCDPSIKPANKENCTNEEDCTGTFMTGPWTECSASCAGGTQTRTVVCFTWDLEADETMCDEAEQPISEQQCNPDPCPTCSDSEFGCCPNNSTFSMGEFNEGCSNCSVSEFGCCKDNVTEAMGDNNKACLGEESEDESTSEDMSSSGEQPESESESDASSSDESEEKMCTYKNEKNGDNVTVACVEASKQSANLMLGNETMLNITEGNATVHCSKTEFGCCPDWYTNSEGGHNQGCIDYELGTCNGTKFGCCPDNVTLARGENSESCGSPECSGSLYGCCKDRNTIAFGPHYFGCERSSFPCEKSEFGCCPDGETAALGGNGDGCESSCLFSKYGCCPDGETPSEGTLNEGCGCGVSQFGCCPDGETPAAGPNFSGCPVSCAQSTYGCCPDGKTRAGGPNNHGCPCQYTQFGCCPDGETAARDENKDSCEDCRFWKFGCCWDGVTKAQGSTNQGCPATTPSPLIVSGTVSPDKIAGCAQPLERGELCSDWQLVWYYDTHRGKCTQDYYGGCGGNENRFDNEDDCRLVCVQPPGRGVCYLPLMEGDKQGCDKQVVRYFYNISSASCTPFYYRECNRELANRNNFQDYNTCRRYCQGVSLVTEQPRQGQRPDPRFADPRPRPTRPMPTRPIETRPMPTRREPRPDLRTEQPMPVPLPDSQAQTGDVCLQVLDSGPCRKYVTKWFYERNNKRCETFIYGGCGGTGNQFSTKESCERRCNHLMRVEAPIGLPVDRHRMRPDGTPHQTREDPRAVCNEMMAVGSCKGNFEKFYFEKATGVCQRFMYSGCGGTRNRFNSIDECQRMCQSQSGGVLSVSITPDRRPTQQSSALTNKQHPCTLPRVSGPCQSAIPSFFFDRASQRCLSFLFGGCYGNNNNFETAADCERQCISGLHAPYSVELTAVMPASHKSMYATHNAAPVHPLVSPPTLDIVQNLIEAENIVQHIIEEIVHPYCGLPKAPGPCKANEEAWYYDPENTRCRRFKYGGCQGNYNRFNSLESCRRACSNAQYYVNLRNQPRDIIHQEIPVLQNIDMNVVKHEPQTIINDIEQIIELTTPKRDGTLPTVQSIQQSENLVDFEDFEDHSVDEMLEITNEIIEQPPIDISINVDACALPHDFGSCNGEEDMWYFDVVDKVCQRFAYSGCGGNANRFASDRECQKFCDGGRVGGFEKRKEEIIVEMENNNNNNNNENELFKEKELDSPHRVDRPAPLPAVVYHTPQSILPDLCKLAEDKGSCFGEDLMWRYDSEDNKCTSFMWTGCGGNANKFSSHESCMRACGLYRDQAVCTMPQDIGDCELTVNKWYFDTFTMDCKPFLYTGCHGNGNRFSTREDCLNLCTSDQNQEDNESGDEMGNDVIREGHQGQENLCNLGMEAGPCMDAVTQWHFDSKHGKCKPFTYGGCRGNRNRFDNKDDCQAACAKKKLAALQNDRDVCGLLFDSGPCRGEYSKYYYDFSSGVCKQFIYNGCKGNGNNFQTKQACQQFCHGYTVDTGKLHSEVEVLVDSNSVNVGEELELECNLLDPQHRLQQTTTFTWFKDAKRINTADSNRIRAAYNLLTIGAARLQDAGSYTCASEIGNAIVSQSVNIKINGERDPNSTADPNCVDKLNMANCPLIVRIGLCSHRVYGVLCCASCQTQISSELFT